jgi:hypothetical protein
MVSTKGQTPASYLESVPKLLAIDVARAICVDKMEAFLQLGMLRAGELPAHSLAGSTYCC